MEKSKEVLEKISYQLNGVAAILREKAEYTDESVRGEKDGFFLLTDIIYDCVDQVNKLVYNNN